MGEAIETTQLLYPGLLERNPNLLFTLKCRQFVEMVNGADSEVRGSASRSPRSYPGSGNGSNRSSPSLSPAHNTSSNASSAASHILHHHHQSQPSRSGGSASSSPSRVGKISRSSTPGPSSSAASTHSQQQQPHSGNPSDNVHCTSEDMKNAANSSPSSERFVMNGSGHGYIEDEENMELSDGMVEDGLVSNGNCDPAAVCMNGNSHQYSAEDYEAEDMGK